MKLAVVGSINTDMTVTAERIPLKGETLMGDSLSYIPGGKGANQAVAMAKLGAEVEMFGCVGNDDNGRRMLDNLNRVGVKTEHIQVLEGVPTGIAMITVSDNACVRLLPGCQNTLLFFRHEDELYHLVKSEHLSRVFCDLCSHTDNPELPEATLLYVSFQTLPSLS